MRRHALRSLALAALLAGALPAAHAQTGNRVSFHGFGGWAAGWTDNDNSFGSIASNDRDLRNYYFGLNVAAQPTENISIHAQPFWVEDRNGRRADLDYAFAQWRASDAFVLKLGKVRNPLGIYTEVYDVGTLRPFYLLPPGRYAGTAKAFVGAGVSGRVPSGGWELEYDAFAGEALLQPLELELPVGVDPSTGMPVLQTVAIEPRGEDFYGGRLALRPPVDGLEFGASYVNYRTVLELGPYSSTSDLRLLIAHLDYSEGSWILRSEASWSMGGDLDLETGYAEAAYQIDSHWQIAASVDWRNQDDASQPIDSLREHTGFGAALNYWFSPGLVLKLNYYNTSGNFLARSSSPLQSALLGTLEDSTDVVILGAQFSF